MDSELPLFGDADLSAKASALAQTVISIRSAQGKSLPRDLLLGSLEWETAALEFVRDVERVLAGESDQT
ncbi:hypothetical protein [Caballeronia sp. DA-9]|uniref:hypothetical protein n=1 Tax=Caballeronia sp. DA-9 TaxID=3436237 RepID=UPI003F67111A